MGRKSRDGDSSLELLLDTMCNTFGGVMFIAIALVVIMTMLGKVEKKLDHEAERAELQENIEKLKAELKRTAARNQEQETLLRRLQNDPRRDWIARLLQKEKELSQEKLLLQALQSQQKLAEQSALAAGNKLQEETARHAALEQSRKKHLTEREKLNRELAQIRRDKDKGTAAPLTFRLMERSDLAPYYLIAAKGRLYRVGPEQLLGPEAMQPHADCTMQAGTAEGKTYYACVPGSAGTPIRENGTLSAAAIALLKKLPQDRVPLFSIDKESMADFCLLREYLKSRKILHGANVYYGLNKCVVYFITDKAEYEY